MVVAVAVVVMLLVLRRGVELIREVGEHTEEQRVWETVVPQETGDGGGGIGGGGRGD